VIVYGKELYNGLKFICLCLSEFIERKIRKAVSCIFVTVNLFPKNPTTLPSLENAQPVKVVFEKQQDGHTLKIIQGVDQ